MKRRFVRICIITATVLAVCAALYMGVVYSYHDNDQIVDQIRQALKLQGVPVQQVSLNHDVLSVEYITQGTQRITPEDITAHRMIRNEARKKENAKHIRNLHEVIETHEGKVIYDGTINNINVVPNVDETSSLSASIADKRQVEQALTKALSTDQYEILAQTISDGALGGKQVDIELQIDNMNISCVNDTIPRIQTLIEQLNKADEAGIYQFNLSIVDGSNRLLLFLSADLVYRDFLWWQTPEFGNDTWTKTISESPVS